MKKAQKALDSVTENKALIDSLTAEIKTLTAEQKQIQKQITAYNNQIAKLQSGAADVSIDGQVTAQRLSEAQAKYDTALSEYNAAEAKKEQTAAALRGRRTLMRGRMRLMRRWTLTVLLPRRL